MNPRMQKSWAKICALVAAAESHCDDDDDALGDVVVVCTYPLTFPVGQTVD